MNWTVLLIVVAALLVVFVGTLYLNYKLPNMSEYKGLVQELLDSMPMIAIGLGAVAFAFNSFFNDGDDMGKVIALTIAVAGIVIMLGNKVSETYSK